ncbi:hypothetical protein HMPREF9554_00306 [Treponema phagedenis F0421]|nr:hypothetical protein HMPREF9554_00306 [Treponema phagedenis F0421]
MRNYQSFRTLFCKEFDCIRLPMRAKIKFRIYVVLHNEKAPY